jgi:enamine deaminase RidA (YjgF/YER057c/UK114 family)
VGERSGSGPDQAAVVEALNTLGRAIDQAVSSVTGAVKDPAVRDDAKGALDAMGDALNSTFAEYGDLVGDKVKQTFGRKDDSGSSR